MRKSALSTALLVAGAWALAIGARADVVTGRRPAIPPLSAGPKAAPVKAAGSKALFDAVSSGQTAAVAALLGSGRYSARSFVDNEANTPLHLIAERCAVDPRDRIQLIRYLIANGGDIHAKNKWGDTPAQIARVKCGGPVPVMVLLNGGALPELPAGRSEPAAPPQRQVQPPNAAPWLQRGDQLLASGAYDQAIQAYEQARRLDPTNPAVYNGEGLAQYQLRKYALAEWAFKTALQYAPNNPAVKANLDTTQRAIADANRRFQQTYDQTMRERAQQNNSQLFRNALAGFDAGYAAGQAMSPQRPAAPTPPRSTPALPTSQPPQGRQVASAPSPPQPSGPPGSTSSQNLGACIVLRPGPTPGSFWRVVNNCQVAVIGALCFVNDTNFNCGTQGAAGFGPIRPGGWEATTGPSSSASQWRATACAYDDWVKGQCHYGKP